MITKLFSFLSSLLILTLLTSCSGVVGGQFITAPTVNPVFGQNPLTYQLPTISANALETEQASAAQLPTLLATATQPVNLPNPVTGEGTATPEASSTQEVTGTPLPTFTSTPLNSNNPPPAYESNTKRIRIYDDYLNSDWQVISTNGMSFQVGVTDQFHGGKVSILAKSARADGQLLFTLKPDSKVVYPRNMVIGIDFWLYSGDQGLGLYDLAVSAIGSNDYTTYIPGDLSGQNEKPYEDTWLYFLGFNDNIPPKTWVNVTLWLDNMQFDPHYKYVTGFYIKNRFNFLRPFYVDDVFLVVSDKYDEKSASSVLTSAPGGALETPSALTPTLTETPTPTGTKPGASSLKTSPTTPVTPTPTTVPTTKK